MRNIIIIEKLDGTARGTIFASDESLAVMGESLLRDVATWPKPNELVKGTGNPIVVGPHWVAVAAEIGPAEEGGVVRIFLYRCRGKMWWYTNESHCNPIRLCDRVLGTAAATLPVPDGIRGPIVTVVERAASITIDGPPVPAAAITEAANAAAAVAAANPEPAPATPPTDEEWS